MINNKELFIFGEPIETDFGMLRFLTYKEYLQNISELSLISQNILHLYYLYKKQLEQDKVSKEYLDEFKQFKEQSLYSVVVNTEYILEAYVKIMKLVIDCNNYAENELMDIISLIFSSEDYFIYIRKMIMDMNILTEDDVSPNEEIQRGIERSRRVKQQENEKSSFVDSTSNTFEDVCNMTVFQVYAIYARIGAIFNYNTTTLFATVAEKVKIESWNKHIDLFEKENHAIDYSKFSKQFGSMLDD